MKLIKDLGLLYPKANSKQKRHFLLYECSNCKKHIRKRSDKILKYSTCNSCTRIKLHTTHGYSKHKLYNSWREKLERCNNPKNISYKYYGARGITVSDEFQNVETYILYIESLENAYKDGYTIDRIDNDKNYERNNLRWASQLTQSSNTRLLYKSNKSGYRGVHFSKKSNKYRSVIQINYKQITLGFYIDKLEAAKAYDIYVIENNLQHTINGVLKSNIKDNICQ